MDWLTVVILSIVQGITEWLPVSSSGHLAIIQTIFNLNVPVFFDILLHLGSIAAVVFIFREDIIKIITAVLRFDFKSEEGKLALFIIAASIPTAIIGFAFKSLFESFFTNLLAVGIALLVTGTFLFICERFSKNKELKLKDALIIGAVQGIAIIPGISRSGSTIGTGLLLGIDKEKAARFSFLLAIPAIVGATIFDFSAAAISSVGLQFAIAGIVLSALVSFFAIKWLLDIIKKQRFHWFAVYCWLIGLAVIVYTLV
ncbi:MAG: undecaprenyl-diphosphate phosphatase [Candidatus Nanoarchaeia archaeon]|nr:undecaprenyl-diphosphate phosphatase [Candidatus Nanoarchaeia archaeon]MDD5239733.1 undecaprenyl-diphosphate phosphatase [Candidatus Nanoarchaeia archaeon]